MYKPLSLIAALVCGVLLHSPATTLAEEAGVDTISRDIQYVNSFGEWRVERESGPQDGHYRLIVLSGKEAPGSARVYLQWIAADKSTGEFSIVGFKPVSEINAAGIFEVVEAPKIREPATVELVLASALGGEVRTVHIRPVGLSGYQFMDAQPAPNTEFEAAVRSVPLDLDNYIRPSF